MPQRPFPAHTVFAGLAGTPVLAEISARDSRQLIESAKTHPARTERRIADVPEEGMAVATLAGPTAAALARGIENAVRFYVTDCTATLSWKEPGFVFAPHVDEGGTERQGIAAETAD